MRLTEDTTDTLPESWPPEMSPAASPEPGKVLGYMVKENEGCGGNYVCSSADLKTRSLSWILQADPVKSQESSKVEDGGGEKRRVRGDVKDGEKGTTRYL